MISGILSLNILLWLIATALSIYYMKKTRMSRAWVIVAVPLTLMAVKRSISLYEYLLADPPIAIHLLGEVFALLIISFVIFGIYIIGNELIKSESLHKKLLFKDFSIKKASSAIYWLDSKSNFIEVNHAACKLLGYTEEELIGKHISIIDIGLSGEHKHATQTGSTKIIKSRHKTKDNRIFPVEVKTNFFEFEDQHYTCTFVTDMSESIRLNEELIERNERIKAAYDDAPIGMALVTSEHSIIEANESFYTMLGYDYGSLTGSFIADLTHHDDITLSSDKFKTLINGEISNYEFEKRYLNKQGDAIWAQLKVASVLDKKGAFKYAIAQIQDISDRKQIENSFEKSYRIQKTLNQANDAILHIIDEPKLIKTTCEIIVKTGGYIMSAIGFLQDDETQSVDINAYYGKDDETLALANNYFKSADIKLTDKLRGSGPIGQAIRTRQTYICNSTAKDPNFAPWRKHALKLGYASAIAIPLIINETSIGVLLVYADEENAFIDAEEKLLEKLAENLTFGISLLRARKMQKESNEQYRLLVENSPYCIHTINLDGRLESMNQSGLTMMHCNSESEVIDTMYLDIVATEDADRVNGSLQRAYSGESSQFEFKGKDGRDFLASFVPIYDDQGHGLRVMGMSQDISKRKQADEEIRKLSLSVEHSPNIIMITNSESIIEYVNPKFTELTGYSMQETLGKKPIYFIKESFSKKSYQSYKESIDNGKVWSGEFVSEKKNGELFLSKQTIFAISDDAGKINNIVSIHEDITESRRLEDELSYHATHDDLTGLLNRREFERRANRLVSNIGNDGSEHALCFMDLDQFKVVNDTCGHIAGDHLLRQLSNVLNKVVRKRDTLARLGGDEFGVLMEHCSLEGAHRVAQSLQSAIREYQFSWEGNVFKVGVSIGLTAITNKTLDTTQLLKEADAACYIAKERGRNRIFIHNAEDTGVTIQQGEMQWVSQLHQALEQDRFLLFAQEIQPLDSSTDKHFELLLRLENNSGEMIMPGAFLPAAEHYNIISQLDRWVVSSAFSMLANNPGFLSDTNFCSINLSGLSMVEHDFLDFIIKKLRSTSLDGHKICFEITETAAITNLEIARKFISTLKDLGCRFALDDFGSGLSSFAYLKNLPVDYLKIDGLFVKDIAVDPIDNAMVRSINEIGHVMGMMTIAEFVENDVIKGMLKEIGVDYGQGYSIAKPRPLTEIMSNTSNLIQFPFDSKK